MRIEILDGAEKDLLEGFEFYEGQSEGLGSYFLDSVLSDIESLHLYAGIHATYFVIIDCWRSAFHSLFITKFKIRQFKSMQYLIADVIPPGFMSS